jgi:hypothetical protein
MWPSWETPAGMTDSQPKDTIWTKVNVLAAVLASLVALGGLLYTVRSSSASGAASSSSTSASSSTGAAASTAPTSMGTSSASQPLSSTTGALSLTSLTPAAGAGNVTRKGTNLTMACGTNQSDDLFREVQYTLPATRHFAHFQATVHGGIGDADQQFTVTAFVRGQYVRADQTREIGGVTFGPGANPDLRGDLTADVDTLVLRLQCHLPGAFVTITGAQLLP